MKTYTQEQLSEILKEHKKWLFGNGGKRANLSSAELRSADLSSSNLISADLRSANLRSANLRSADLRSADLRSADLRSADLSFADLSFADLSSANLRYAELRSADLSSSNLISADLHSANLSSANLISAVTDKQYLSISCIGSRKGMTTFCVDDKTIWCGCWSGTLEDFIKRVHYVYKSGQYRQEYDRAIKFFKSFINIY